MQWFWSQCQSVFHVFHVMHMFQVVSLLSWLGFLPISCSSQTFANLFVNCLILHWCNSEAHESNQWFFFFVDPANLRARRIETPAMTTQYIARVGPLQNNPPGAQKTTSVCSKRNASIDLFRMEGCTLAYFCAWSWHAWQHQYRDFSNETTHRRGPEAPWPLPPDPALCAASSENQPCWGKHQTLSLRDRCG